MQKKRNTKLFLILLVTILAVVVAYFATRPEDKLKVSRDLFSYKDPSNINRVIFSNDTSTHVLAFEDNQWVINKKYQADPRRVSVLFAILKQMRVRRQVARKQEQEILNKLDTEGTKVTFYEGDDPVHEFYVWGNEESSLTYVAESPEDQEVYIIEIPGYRNYLAGIFLLDENGWRDPLVFNMNWSNLSSVKFIYPGEPEHNFNIEYDGDFYAIPQITATDSAKLVDLLDDISLLYVNDYLNEKEEEKYGDIINSVPQASLQVQDVGENVYTLEIYDKLPNNKEIIGRIDSTDYAVFDVDKIRRILRPRYFFNKK